MMEVLGITGGIGSGKSMVLDLLSKQYGYQVLRTDEISLEDEAHQLMDMETEKEAVSPWQRMWNVLVKIWQAIVAIFKER